MNIHRQWYSVCFKSEHNKGGTLTLGALAFSSVSYPCNLLVPHTLYFFPLKLQVFSTEKWWIIQVIYVRVSGKRKHRIATLTLINSCAALIFTTDLIPTARCVDQHAVGVANLCHRRSFNTLLTLGLFVTRTQVTVRLPHLTCLD